MLGRCIQWAGPTSVRGAEWFYSGLGSIFVYISSDFIKEYFGLEVAFSSQFLQLVFSFIFSLLIVFSLRLFIAPFVLWNSDIRSLTKLARSRLESIESADRRLKEISLDRAKLVAKIDRMIGGGLTDDGSSMACLIIVSIYNVGGKPSIAESPTMKIDIGEKIIWGNIQEITGTIDMGSARSSDGTINSQKFYSKDALYKVASNPIMPGALARGFLFALFPASEVNKNNIKELVFSCTDIFDQVVSASYRPKASDQIGWRSYIPGINVDYNTSKSDRDLDI